jgi:hypothetical protein
VSALDEQVHGTADVSALDQVDVTARICAAKSGGYISAGSIRKRRIHSDPDSRQSISNVDKSVTRQLIFAQGHTSEGRDFFIDNAILRGSNRPSCTRAQLTPESIPLRYSTMRLSE